jgi:hypothetical protein
LALAFRDPARAVQGETREVAIAHQIAQELAEVNLDQLTPMQAFDLLRKLKEKQSR